MPEEYEGISIREYLRIFFKRKAIFGAIFLSIMGIAFLYVNLSTPLYQTSAKILIIGKRGEEVPYQRELPVHRKEEITRTQSELIMSAPVLEEVVKVLHLDKRPSPPSLLSFLFGTKIEPTTMEEAVRRLKGRVAVSPIPASDLLSVSAVDHEPRMAAKIANTVVKVYMEKSLDIKGEEARTTHEFIDKQLEETENRLREAEAALENFKKMHDIVAIDKEITQKTAALGDLEAKYIATKAEREEVEALIRGSRAQLQRIEKNITSSETLRRNPLINELSSHLATLQVRLATLLTQYKEAHPLVKSVKREIEETNARLKEAAKEILDTRIITTNPEYSAVSTRLIELEARLAALRASEEALKNMIREFKDRLKLLSEREVEFGRLQREVDVLEQSYLTLSRERETALISEAMRLTDIRMVEPAPIPTSPIHPRKRFILSIAFMVSLALSIGLAFLAEYLDHSLETPEAVRKYLNLPTLASIPLHRR